jgi:hypothetical protein
MTDFWEDGKVIARFFNPHEGESVDEVEAFLDEKGLISITFKDAWLELSPVCAKALAEQLCEATGDSIEAIFPPKPSPENNSQQKFSQKEKNTLLILIAALCKEAKIDPDVRGVSSAIRELTEQIGAPVGDDTIKKVLGQLQAAIDSRSR